MAHYTVWNTVYRLYHSCLGTPNLKLLPKPASSLLNYFLPDLAQIATVKICPGESRSDPFPGNLFKSIWTSVDPWSNGRPCSVFRNSPETVFLSTTQFPKKYVSEFTKKSWIGKIRPWIQTGSKGIVSVEPNLVKSKRIKVYRKNHGYHFATPR